MSWFPAACNIVLLLGFSLVAHASPVDDYLGSQSALVEGDTSECHSAQGVYDLIYGPGDQRRVMFDLVTEPQELLNLGFHRFAVAYRYSLVRPSGELHLKGYFFFSRNRSHWFLLTLSEERLASMPMIRAAAASAAVVAHLNGTALPDGYTVDAFRFDVRMQEGQGESDHRLVYNEMGSVRQFLDPLSRDFSSAFTMANDTSVRVPPSMYTLVVDGEFQRARNEGRYAQVLDRIFQRAMEVSNRNTLHAAFIALRTTDLRARGNCGAVYGLRGRTLVPQSIFDHERPTYLDRNRLDATQHFFAYSMIGQLEGSELVELAAIVGKENQYYLPRFENGFQYLHGGSGRPDGGGYDSDRPSITDGAAESERALVEIERDIFYNTLGFALGRALPRNPRALPSQVIHGEYYSDDYRRLGLVRMARAPWEAYDPDREVPHVATRSPEEREPMEDPRIRERDEFPNTEAFLDYARDHCLNSTKRVLCEAYHDGVRAIVEDLYVRNHARDL